MFMRHRLGNVCTRALAASLPRVLPLIHQSSFDSSIMPLTWFSAPALPDEKSQLDRQTQFGCQRFVSEQTSDQMVSTTLVVIIQYI